MTNDDKSLTVVEPFATGLSMSVRTFEELDRLSKLIITAGGMIPSHLKNAGQVAAVVLTAQELGLGTMAAMRGLSLVEGKVTMDQSLVLALVHRAGIKTRWKISNTQVATIVFTRGIETHEETFEWADAVRAGLTGKKVWQSWPKAMLRARAVTAGARAFCPEIFFGSVYSAEELGADQAELGTLIEIPVTATPEKTPDPNEPKIIDAVIDPVDVAPPPEEMISSIEAKMVTDALCKKLGLSPQPTPEEKALAKDWLVKNIGVESSRAIPRSKLTEAMTLLDEIA